MITETDFFTLLLTTLNEISPCTVTLDTTNMCIEQNRSGGWRGTIQMVMHL